MRCQAAAAVGWLLRGGTSDSLFHTPRAVLCYINQAGGLSQRCAAFTTRPAPSLPAWPATTYDVRGCMRQMRAVRSALVRCPVMRVRALRYKTRRGVLRAHVITASYQPQTAPGHPSVRTSRLHARDRPYRARAIEGG